MSEKKRKARSNVDGTPRKKPAVASSNDVVKVHAVPSDGFVKPVIASTPGISLPSKAKFESYSNGSEILLQTSSHPTIDFTGTEDSKGDRAPLKHYVAVYDPATSKLEMSEARKITIRGQVRSQPKDQAEQDAADAAAAANAISNYTSRAALTETFGTKKSKKAVQSIAENRLLAADGEDESNNPLSNALLATMPSEEIMQDGVDVVQANKPLPSPNLSAGTNDEIYPYSSLVVGSERTLDSIDVSDWQTAIEEHKDIQTRSRFVASRLEAYVRASFTDSEREAGSSSKALKRLRTLRYILILIEFSNVVSAKGGHSSGRRAMPTEKMLQKFADPKPPKPLIESIRRHFVPPDGTMRSFETQLLHTTICALTLHLPLPRLLEKPMYHYMAEPTAIRDDLDVDDKIVRQYYRELGCRLDRATEAEATAFGLKKKKKSKVTEGGADALAAKDHDIRLAKLRLPLAFPKRSSGKPNRGR